MDKRERKEPPCVCVLFLKLERMTSRVRAALVTGAPHSRCLVRLGTLSRTRRFFLRQCTVSVRADDIPTKKMSMTNAHASESQTSGRWPPLLAPTSRCAHRVGRRRSPAVLIERVYCSPLGSIERTVSTRPPPSKASEPAPRAKSWRRCHGANLWFSRRCFPPRGGVACVGCVPPRSRFPVGLARGNFPWTIVLVGTFVH